MKLMTLSLFTFLSLSAHAQFRPGGVLPVPTDGTISSVSYATSTDRCSIGSFQVYADGTNANTAQLGHSVCRQLGAIGTDGFTAIAGSYRNTASDIDPTTTCRLEGTVTTTNLIAATCGVDP